MFPRKVLENIQYVHGNIITKKLQVKFDNNGKGFMKICSCKKCHMAFFYFSILCILILDMEIKQKCIKNGKIMGGNENNEEI